jgi:hypothetical protein
MVFIKSYGWCKILKIYGSRALIEINNQKIVYNILGLEIKN